MRGNFRAEVDIEFFEGLNLADDVYDNLNVSDIIIDVEYDYELVNDDSGEWHDIQIVDISFPDATQQALLRQYVKDNIEWFAFEEAIAEELE